MFKQTELDFGIIPANEKKAVIFQYEGDLEVTRIHTTCGCTEAQWDKENKAIKAYFTPGPIPQHLIAQGKTSYKTNKGVTVETNKGVFNLKFIAEILK